MMLELLPFSTERLALRALTSKDAEALWGIHSDQQAMRYWSSPVLTDKDQAKVLLNRLLESAEAAESMTIMIDYQGRCIGRIALFNYSEQCQRLELGYILSSPYWRKGLMREALSALINKLFSDHQIYRIEADIDPDNKPSAGLLSSLGFALEGRLRARWLIDGKRSDSLIYGLIKPEG